MPVITASDRAMIEGVHPDLLADTCALSVTTDGTYDHVTNTTTGATTTTYEGPCRLHDGVPETVLNNAAAEGSPIADAEGWLRLPAVGESVTDADGDAGDTFTAALFVMFRNHTSDLGGTVTSDGLSFPVSLRGLEKRRTHVRAYFRYTGDAEVSS